VRAGTAGDGRILDDGATAKILADGWGLAQCDLGYFDADGYLHLVDRVNDVIVTGITR